MTSKHKAVAYTLIVFFSMLGEVICAVAGTSTFVPLSMAGIALVGTVAVNFLGAEKTVELSL